MNRVKVKTKEQVKSVKALDRAAVAGERMKNAYIRTREKAVRNREDRQNSPTEYAEERVQEYARSMARNTVRTARFGGKVIRQKGQVILQRYQDSRDEAPPTECDFTTPKGAIYKDSFFQGDTPLSSRPNPMAQKQQYQRYFHRIKKTPAQDISDGETISPYAPTPNLITERGREFAKKQAAKRSKITREIKTKEALTVIRQKDDSLDFLPKTIPQMSPEIAIQGLGKTRKIPTEIVNGQPVLLSIKKAIQKKSAVRSALSADGENLRQTVFRPTIKTARHDTRATVQAIQRAAETSQLAERAEKISRFAAKSAATAAKKAAKVSAVAIKAVLLSAKTLVAAIAAGGGAAVLGIVVICLVGQLVCSSFGIFFSGEDSRTGQTVTTAIREIDQEYQDRLASIQNSIDYDHLDMSGTPAPWRDILAIYAVRTTTDPDDGQEVVTMDDKKKALLRDVFWDMNQITDWVTEEYIEVSSTTTDADGNIVDTTEIEVEVTLHISISHRTANEMADAYHFDTKQREQRDFLLSAENRSLWDMLLRGTGISVGGGGGGDIVSVALSQVGNVGGEPYWNWYGFDSRVEWCACFVSWCANESGCLGTAVPRFASCADGVAWFWGQGRWQSSGYLPQPGDIIFFDWDQDLAPDHVGIVEKVESGVIYTIEGNSAGDRCGENRYTVGSGLILGYGTTL